MKHIKLADGGSVMVDDEDFMMLSRFKWYRVVPVKGPHLSYAACKVKKPKEPQKTVIMHRLIMNAPSGKTIDHIDGNGLNNQKSNLRICSTTENNINCRMHKTNKTGYRGVSKRSNGKFRAYISINNYTHHIGSFDTAEQAALARNEIASKIHGEFVRLNTLV